MSSETRFEKNYNLCTQQHLVETPSNPNFTLSTIAFILRKTGMETHCVFIFLLQTTGSCKPKEDKNVLQNNQHGQFLGDDESHSCEWLDLWMIWERWLQLHSRGGREGRHRHLRPFLTKAKNRSVEKCYGAEMKLHLAPLRNCDGPSNLNSGWLVSCSLSIQKWKLFWLCHFDHRNGKFVLEGEIIPLSQYFHMLGASV